MTKVKETIFFVPKFALSLINIINERPISPALLPAIRKSLFLGTRVQASFQYVPGFFFLA